MREETHIKIKKLLKGTCNSAWKTQIVVNNYKEVINQWIYYKNKGKILLDSKEIKDAFEFHSNNRDHILLYYSKNKTTGLLLCRINKRIINLIIPSEQLNKYDSSIIATYS